MKLSKNITTNHCKIILIYSKQCNFYDTIVDFITRDRKSKHISKNVLVVKKTNTILTENTKKFNIGKGWCISGCACREPKQVRCWGVLTVERELECVLLWSYGIDGQHRKVNGSTAMRSETWNLWDSSSSVLINEGLSVWTSHRSEIRNLNCKSESERPWSWTWLINMLKNNDAIHKTISLKLPPLYPPSAPFIFWPRPPPHDNIKYCRINYETKWRWIL